MRQTWRWFGPPDSVTIDEIHQAGAQGVVSALHHLATGEVWSKAEIAKRQFEIAHFSDGQPSGLTWDVAESLPVSEAIKMQSDDWRRHITNYKQSMTHLAEVGISTICYNFMPALDWTRTDLAYTLENKATCMRFDLIDFVLFDLFILKRDVANHSYSQEVVEQAEKRFRDTDDAYHQRLVENIVCGLPGSTESFSLAQLREYLARYQHISAEQFRKAQYDFIAEVALHAESLGTRLCCHPDDPPEPLLGLPRVMSTEADYIALRDAVDSPANGITLCSGSLGARADNDLPGMMNRLGEFVHFLHLRNVFLESDAVFGSFHESDHLQGHVDMVKLVSEVLAQEHHRKKTGRVDYEIPFRADHGQEILADLQRAAQPGYPVMGRLKGLAEIRGIELGIKHAKGWHDEAT